MELVTNHEQPSAFGEFVALVDRLDSATGREADESQEASEPMAVSDEVKDFLGIDHDIETEVIVVKRNIIPALLFLYEIDDIVGTIKYEGDLMDENVEKVLQQRRRSGERVGIRVAHPVDEAEVSELTQLLASA